MTTCLLSIACRSSSCSLSLYTLEMRMCPAPPPAFFRSFCYMRPLHAPVRTPWQDPRAATLYCTSSHEVAYQNVKVFRVLRRHFQLLASLNRHPNRFQNHLQGEALWKCIGQYWIRECKFIGMDSGNSNYWQYLLCNMQGISPSSHATPFKWLSSRMTTLKTTLQLPQLHPTP